MRETSHCDATPAGRCSLCGDEALPGRVIAVEAAQRLADVAIGERHETVALDLVEAVRPGDIVLVHQGFAIGRVDPI